MTTRRELLIGAASLALVPACGNGGGGMPDSPSGPSCASQIANNHGHVLTVPPADLSSMTDHHYDIHGTADHTHDVLLTSAALGMLATGATITVTSSLSAGHTHDCMVHCTS